MARGIRNVSGVSCHISCALQLLARALLTPLVDLWCELAPSGSRTAHEQLGLFLHELLLQNIDNTDDDTTDDTNLSPPFSSLPLDPRALYKSLTRRTNLDPNNVGDVSSALYKLIQFLAQGQPQGQGQGQGQQGDDWERLLKILILGGQTRQIIRGTTIRIQTPAMKEEENTILLRTKPGKIKRMACPFPLVGFYDSVTGALTMAQSPMTLRNYDWESQANDAYTEECRPLTDRNVQEEEEEAHVPPLPDEWTTTKSVHFESLPAYWFLSLERFSYTHDNEKVLSNPSVSIPLQLDVPDFSIASSPSSFAAVAPPEEPTWHLMGGVVHVTDESIDEEGHVVTLLREGYPYSSTTTSSSASTAATATATESSSWMWIDDEICRSVPSTKQALEFLAGTHDDEGRFCCGILLLYVNMEQLSAMEPELNAISDRLRKQATGLAQQQQQQQQGKDDDIDKIPEALDWLQEPDSIVGRKLAIKWAKGKYYAGVVESFDATSGKHRVLYDDGDTRDYKLAKKKIQWL